MSEPPALKRAQNEDIARIDWSAVRDSLDARGFALMPRLLTREQCTTIAAMYPDDARFRSHIHMARHGFGRGE